MPYEAVMKLPVRVFWTLNRNILRISAERDIRALTLGAAANSKEAYEEYRKRLELEVGEIVREPPAARANQNERDEEGIAFLKMLAARQ